MAQTAQNLKKENNKKRKTSPFRLATTEPFSRPIKFPTENPEPPGNSLNWVFSSGNFPV